MKHPEIFSAIYALSPCCLGLEGDMGETNTAWSRVLGLKSREQVPREPKSFEDFFVTAFVALSAAFSEPRARTALRGRTVSERDGRIRRKTMPPMLNGI